MCKIWKSVVDYNPDVVVTDGEYMWHHKINSELVMSYDVIKESFETLSELKGDLITIDYIGDDDRELLIKFAKQFNRVYCSRPDVLSIVHDDLQEKMINQIVRWNPKFNVRDNNIYYRISEEHLFDAPYDKINQYWIGGDEDYCKILSAMIGSCKKLEIRCEFGACFLENECEYVYINYADSDEVMEYLQCCKWKNISFPADDYDLRPIRISPSILSITPICIENYYQDQIAENRDNYFRSRFARVKAIC